MHAIVAKPRGTSPAPAPLPPLPLEIWDGVQRAADVKTFVAMRGVNHAWRNLATPAHLKSRLLQISGDATPRCPLPRDSESLAELFNRRLRAVAATDSIIEKQGGVLGVTMGPWDGRSQALCAVAFSNDGRHVVAGAWDWKVRVWDLLGDPSSETKILCGHQGEVYAVAYSPDNRYIVSASQDRTARVWDMHQDPPVFKVLRGHQDTICDASFSSDGRYVVTASHDDTARVWEWQREPVTFKELRAPHPVIMARFVRDGTRVATASIDRTTHLWDVEHGAPRAERVSGYSGCPALFSPDSRYLLTLLSPDPDGNRAQLWDMRQQPPSARDLRGHTYSLLSVEFSRDGNRAVTASADTTAIVWDLQHTQPKGHALRGHRHCVAHAAFSADGRFVVTASYDRSVRLWRAPC